MSTTVGRARGCQGGMRMESEIGEATSLWARQSQLVQAVLAVDEELWLAVRAELAGDQELAKEFIQEAREQLEELRRQIVMGEL